MYAATMRALVTVVVLVGCAPTTPPPVAGTASDAQAERVASLEATVEDIEARLARLEAAPTTEASDAAETGSWSCAAQCVTAYHCREEGDSNVSYKDVYGKGPLAVDAFKDLQTACDDDDLLVIQGICKSGVFEQREASIKNACVRN